jgi:hypothetical protein
VLAILSAVELFFTVLLVIVAMATLGLAARVAYRLHRH